MLSLELRNQVINYVNSEITIEQLEDWYVPRLPLYTRIPDSADAKVIAAIELGLAEYNCEIRSEEELRAFLADTIREYDTMLSLFQPEIEHFSTTGSSNQTYDLFPKPVDSFISVG